jgi:hypothetical protein
MVQRPTKSTPHHNRVGYDGMKLPVGDKTKGNSHNIEQPINIDASK